MAKFEHAVGGGRVDLDHWTCWGCWGLSDMAAFPKPRWRHSSPL
jgi:hypothetical protein